MTAWKAQGSPALRVHVQRPSNLPPGQAGPADQDVLMCPETAFDVRGTGVHGQTTAISEMLLP